MNMQNIMDTITTALTALGLKILGAIAVWIIGRWLIGLTVRLVSAALTRQQVDPTLLRYIGNIVSVALNVVLVVAILGYFGVETTSFAALVAAMGIAIGAAWGGLLSNFAAGAFLITLRPFKVGDYIKAGGVEGTVMEIGIFATAIDSPDNVRNIVGNNKIFSDNIQNFSALPYRRVDCTAKLAHGVDPLDAIARLRQSVTRIPNVLAEPAPVIDLIAISDQGPVLAVRPFAAPAHFGQVYFDTHRAVVQTFKEAGYPLPDAGTAAR